MVIASGLFGGRITCNKFPKINPYIEARLVDKGLNKKR